MGLMKKLTSAIVASSLVFSLVGTAFAAYTPTAGEIAGKRMMDLNILKGKSVDDPLALKDEITRAELVTIIVRAFGQEENAKLLNGAAAYPDTASHWASGNIAMAKALVEKAGGDAIGMPDGSFSPEGKLTPAQAVAFLMKFLGVKADASKAWPANFLDKAVELGIITAADKDIVTPMSNDNATRGLVFYLLDNAFYSYNLGAGKTFYTKYVDPNPPQITLDSFQTTTVDSKITISGTAKEAYELFVGSEKVTLDASGKFSYEMQLPELKEYPVTVIAKDRAGNTDEESLKITRTTGTAASVSAPATLTVKAGASVDLAVAVKDANGNAIAGAPIAIEGTENGAFADGKYTAPTKAGSYTATFKSGDFTASTAVTVTAADAAKVTLNPANGSLGIGGAQKFEAVVADQYDNAVSGAAVVWSAAGGVIDQAGNFAATTAGTATVTATVGSLSGTATLSVFGVPVAVKLAVPASLPANGKSETTVTATVVDANGNVVSNYNGTVDFASSNADIVKVKSGFTSVTAVNGVASATLVVGTVSDDATVTASASGLTTGEATFSAVDQELTSITLKADPAVLAADRTSSTEVKAELLDQAGKAMVSWPTNLEIKLTSGTTSVAYIDGGDTITSLDSVVTLAAGGTKGSTVVKAEASIGDTEYTVAPITISTDVIGGPHHVAVDAIDAVEAGETLSVTFRVLDEDGLQVTNYNGGAFAPSIKIDGDTVTNDGTLTDEGNGKYTWEYVATSAGTLTVKVGGTFVDENGETHRLTDASTTATVTSGEATQVTLSASPSTINANGTATSTLTAKIKDQNGNVVADGSYSVKITRTDVNGDRKYATSGFATVTLTTVNGVATTTVTSSSLTAQVDEFKAEVSGLNSGTVLITSAIIGTAAQLDKPYVDYAATPATSGASDFVVGDNVTVKVRVKDGSDVNAAAAQTVTYESGRNVTLTVYNSDNEVVSTLSATTTNGVASFTVNQTKADAFTFKATASGLTTSAKSDALTYVAGDPVAFKVTPALTTIGQDTGSKTQLKVSMVDEYGNLVAGDASVNFRLSGGASYAKLVDDMGGDYTGAAIDLTTSASGAVDSGVFVQAKGLKGTATVVVSGTVADSQPADASATVTMVKAGLAARLSVPSVTAATVTTASDTDPILQKVVVNAVDANGTVATSFGNNGETMDLYIKGYTDPNAVTFTVYGADKVEILPEAAAGDWDGDSTNDSIVYTGITFANGQAVFYVSNEVAQSLTYAITTADITINGDNATASVKGTFNAAGAYQLAFDSATYEVIKAGAVTTLKFAVQDENGNTAKSATGKVYFELADGSEDFATLLSSEANLVNGVASVTLQAKNITSSYPVEVLVYTDATKDNDGSTDLNGAGRNADNQLSKTITVDGRTPVVPEGADLNLDSDNFATEVDGVLNVGAKPAFNVVFNDYMNKYGTDVNHSGITKVEFLYKATTATSYSKFVTYTFPAPVTDAVNAGGDAEVTLTAADYAATGNKALSAGTWDIIAKGYDAAGNVVSSSKLRVKVADAAAPTIVSATGNETTGEIVITLNEAIEFDAAATDAEKAAAFAFTGVTIDDTAVTVAVDETGKIVTITYTSVDVTATSKVTFEQDQTVLTDAFGNAGKKATTGVTVTNVTPAP